MNQNDFYTYSPEVGGPEKLGSLGGYLQKVFLWMLAGLGVTFGVAFGLYSMPQLLVGMVVRMPYLHIVLAIVQLLIAWNLGRHIQEMSKGMATGLFLTYSLMNGLTFSTLLLVYQATTVIFAFLSAAVYFGVMAVYGAVTQKDLSSWGRLLGGGLIAMLIMSVLGLFLRFGVFELLVCGGGILLFLCLTAYDTQRIKSFYSAAQHDPEMAHKAAIMGALELYLDFINIFLYILRMLGRSRDN